MPKPKHNVAKTLGKRLVGASAVAGRPATTPHARWATRIVGLEYHPAGAIQPHAQNWRGHGPDQQRVMAGILEDIGIAGALLCYRSAGIVTLLDGHMRHALDAAQVWPCLMLDVTDDEADVILATFDPLGALATTTHSQLDALLATTRTDHTSVQALLDALATPRTGHGPQAAGSDVAAAAVQQAVQQYAPAVGQLWAMGRHRLLCGDATDAVAYAQLCGGQAHVGLCLTDPPYGVGEVYAGGCPDTPQRVRARGDAFLSIAATYCRTILVTTGTRCMYDYPRPDWVLSWVCPAGTGVGPWGFCCWHPVLAYGPDPYAGQGSRPDTIVLNAIAPKDTGHPCPKPLEVWAWLMERGSSSPGDTILDPFAGSGTSFLVAEQLERTCYGIELAPEYVAIALHRWAEHTGTIPQLVTHG